MHDAPLLLALAMFCFGLARFMTLTPPHTHTGHLLASLYHCLCRTFHSHFGIRARGIYCGRSEFSLLYRMPHVPRVELALNFI